MSSYILDCFGKDQHIRDNGNKYNATLKNTLSLPNQVIPGIQGKFGSLKYFNIIQHFNRLREKYMSIFIDAKKIFGKDACILNKMSW